jgi:hypothetical protein
MSFRPITMAELESLVRSETLHDSDTQTTSTQIQERLGHEYARAVRFIGDFAPELVTEEDTVTLSSGSRLLKSSLTPARVDSQYDRLVKIEQQVGSYWMQLSQASKSDTGLMSPAVPATYRITYLTGVSFDNTVDPANSGADRKFYLPDGMQLVLVHRVAAFIRQRDDDDRRYHEEAAKEALRDVQRGITYGPSVPICGMLHSRPRVYFGKPSVMFREMADGWELFHAV